MLFEQIDATNTALAAIPGVTTAVGETFLKAEGAMPRFVWVPAEASPEAPKKRDGITTALTELRWPVDVHVWGATPGNAERLAYALLTAVRSATRNNGQLVRLGPLPAERAWTNRGYVLVARIEFRVPVVAQDLATLTDRTATTVTITTVAFDPTTSSETDGDIDAGDAGELPDPEP